MNSFKLRYKFFDFATAKRDYFLCFVRLVREQRIIGSVLRMHRCQIAVAVTVVEEAVRVSCSFTASEGFLKHHALQQGIGEFPTTEAYLVCAVKCYILCHHITCSSES